MEYELNGITIQPIDENGILITTPVNEFIFSVDEIKWIYESTLKIILDKS